MSGSRHTNSLRRRFACLPARPPACLSCFSSCLSVWVSGCLARLSATLYVWVFSAFLTTAPLRWLSLQGRRGRAQPPIRMRRLGTRDQ
eukprot:COSAG02_NODE_58673_length_276_cov_1.169492_1_plen_87_part_10